MRISEAEIDSSTLTFSAIKYRNAIFWHVFAQRFLEEEEEEVHVFQIQNKCVEICIKATDRIKYPNILNCASETRRWNPPWMTED